MSDEIEEIKSKIDIVDFISQYVELKKAGTNFKALCPFHSEKTPSFMVSSEKQIWHCFGCQKGGDIFTFLMEYEGVDFADALKELAEKAGVQLKARDPRLKKTQDELYEINKLAAKFYHFILTRKEPGKKILDYLIKKRGMTNETIKDFEIGYAPDNWEALSKYLVKRDFRNQDILQSGLVIEKGDNSFYDRFRNRIMFPIFDTAKNIIGFSGRIFEGKTQATLGRQTTPGKYINSPDTPIYNKSKIIYALDRAKEEIRKTKQVIIVEGQMDVIACHQAGFKNVVATSGTALTADQLKILKRSTPKISFCFDPDSAGEVATKRAIGLAHQLGLVPNIIVTPQGKDPADIIKENPEEFKKAIKNQKEAVDFYIEKISEKYPINKLSSSQKQEIVEEIMPIIKEISRPILVGDYIRKLARLIDTDEKYLYEAYKRSQKTYTGRVQENAQTFEKTLPENSKHFLLEQEILGLAIKYPEHIHEIFQKLSLEDFISPEHQKIAKALTKSYTKNKGFNKNLFYKLIASKERKLADIYSLKIENDFVDLSSESINHEIIIASQRLRSEKLENIKKNFEQKIAQAEEKGDRKEIKNLIIELQKQIGGANDKEK